MSLVVHEEWMQQALLLARQAESAGEVPVGAILVLNNEVIGRGFNQPIKNHDPSAHAEILALREGGKSLNNYRLVDATLYVTLEPCLMCVGAMVHARIGKLVFGAFDPKSGAAQMLDLAYLNHKVSYEGGVHGEECGSMLKEFFRKKR